MSGRKSKTPSRQEVLEALGSYQKQGIHGIKADELGDMLADESDRGLVVILVSIIEDILLHRLLREFRALTPAMQKDLTRAGGLLNNFDHRIKLAQAMGLIHEDTIGALQVLKAMRNACAHSRKHIGFFTPELRSAMALLFDGGGVADIQSSQSPLALRFVFVSAFIYMTEAIMGKSPEQAQERAQNFMNKALADIQNVAAERKTSLEKRRQQRANRPPQPPKD
jgi:hypothetical protein